MLTLPGSFRIYRAPGSVAFLNCGSALQPILPKSQCWCIEEDSSKFVLQIRRPQYWRIELPVDDQEDAQRAVLLREVLDRVLLFEKTRCPFERSFTVMLPEVKAPPVRKRPWTPRRSLVAPRAGEAEYLLVPGSGGFSGPVLRASRSASDMKVSRPATSQGAGVELKAAGRRETAVVHRESNAAEPSAVSEEQRKPCASAQAEEPEPATPVNSEAPSSGSREGQAEDAEPATALKLEIPTSGNSEVQAAKGAEETLDGTQDSVPRVETPVKVKEVVSVIEERIIEDPTPLTAVNEAITQAQQASALAPAASPTSAKSASPRIRRSTLLSTTSATTATPPSGDTMVRRRASAYEPLAYGRTLAAREPKTECPSPILDAERCASPPAVEEDAEVPPQEEVMFSDNVFDVVHEGSGEGANALRKTKLRRYGGFATTRSATLPPHLCVVTAPPAQPNAKPNLTIDTRTDDSNAEPGSPAAVSPTGSTDSFHSAQAETSPATPPLPASPGSPGVSPQTFPYPHDNILMPGVHHRDVSDLTVTPDTRRTWDATSTSSGASQFSAITAPDQSLSSVECGASESEDGAFASGVQRGGAVRHRSTASIAHRGLSPLPSAATLFNPASNPVAASKRVPVPRPRTPMEVLKRVPLAIVAKTCEVLLGPPAYLVQLMLRVASRISAGEWRGKVFGLGEGGERIPVQWDWSDEDGDLSGWSEDEVEFAGAAEAAAAGRGGVPGGWDDAGPSWGVD